MTNLQALIQSLKAYVVIIIDDEFTFEDQPDRLVGRFCTSKQGTQDLLLKDLREIEEPDLASLLAEFSQELCPLIENSFSPDAPQPQTQLEAFLDHCNRAELKGHEILPILTGKVNNSENSEQILEIFLKYGIYNEGIEHYKKIGNELKEINDCIALYFKSAPNWDVGEDSTFSKIIEIANSRESRFCLAIVDKMLGQNNSGEEVIKDLVRKNENRLNPRFACCLLTSDESQQSPFSDSYEKYFVQIVHKRRSNPNEKVTDSLAINLAKSAYAEVFNYLYHKKIDSAKYARDMVLKNQTNIVQIIAQSDAEGIPGYDAIKSWFDLAMHHKFEADEIAEFKFIAGLSTFFNSENLQNHPNLPDIHDDLLAINTFELFDYNINCKHLPISPGDIWLINNEYYILVGQMCDMLIRGSNNQRNTKLGELFKIRFSEKALQTKYQVEVEKGKKTISIRHFVDAEKVVKTIQIDVSTPNIHFVDLKVLDLSMYNEDGMCLLDLGQNLEQMVMNVLPKSGEEYFRQLYEEFHRLSALPGQENRESLLVGDSLLVSRIGFKFQENKISYPVKRLCRLKGRFYDSFYNNYLNHKGRIDLNIIDNAPEVSKHVNLKFLTVDMDESQAIQVADLALWTSKGKEYFLISDLVNNVLLTQFKELFENFNARIIIEQNVKQYEIRNPSATEYILSHSIRLDKNKPDYSRKLAFTFKDLFGKEKPDEDGFFVGDGLEKKLFIDDQGRPSGKISIAELSVGVKVIDQKVNLKLINGVIQRESYED